MKRGAFIVIEGIDRSGKSTQCKALVDSLRKKQVKAQYMNFPNRQSEVGKVINSYLMSKRELPDEAIHLLFSANRWESTAEMMNLLENGTTLIVDRYCYSGVAFSAAKGLDLEWCKSSDIGLPKPDQVFFMTLPLDVIEQRNGFGDERYERLDFQKRVSAAYKNIMEDDWEVLDANRPMADIQSDLLDKVLAIVDKVGTQDVAKLWI